MTDALPAFDTDTPSTRSASESDAIVLKETTVTELSTNDLDLSELFELAAAVPNHILDLVTGNRAGERQSRQTKVAANGSSELGDFSRVKDACQFVRHHADNPTEQSYDVWLALGSIAVHCRDGNAEFHKISEGHSGYSHSETERKAEEVRANMSPRTCASIEQDIGFEGCLRCPFRAHQHMASPIKLAYQDEALLRILKRYVVIGNTSQYLDVETGDVFEKETIDNMMRAALGASPHSAITGNELRALAVRADYIPGDPRLMIPTGGGHCAVNLYRQGGVEDCDGDPGAILDLFDKLIPDACERQHVLKALAHLVQNPTQKLAYAIILSGSRQGTGKSTLTTKLVPKLFGERNVRVVGGDALADQYKAALTNIQVLCCEEANLSERFETANGIKTLITESTVVVHDKNVRRHLARSPLLILVTSNFAAPLVIKKGDRRYMVVGTTEERQPDAYYSALHQALADETVVGSFKRWLRELPLGDFDPNSPPPRTKAQEAAERASMTPAAQYLTQMIEDREGCFAADLVTLDRVEMALRCKLGSPIRPQQLQQAMYEVGARFLRKIRLAKGKPAKGVTSPVVV